MAGEDLRPLSSIGLHLPLVAYHHQQAGGIARLDDIGKVGVGTPEVGIGRHIGDACELAGFDHGLDLGLIGLPVLHEDTGCARHGQQEGIGGEGVAADRILWGTAGAVFRVVVLDEGDGILAVGGIRHEARR